MDDDASFFDQLVDVESTPSPPTVPSQSPNQTSLPITQIPSSSVQIPCVTSTTSHVSSPTPTPSKLFTSSPPTSFSGPPSRRHSVSRRVFSPPPSTTSLPQSRRSSLCPSALPSPCCVAIGPNGRIFVASSVLQEYSLPTILSRTPISPLLQSLHMPSSSLSKSHLFRYIESRLPSDVESPSVSSSDLLWLFLIQLVSSQGEITEEVISKVSQYLKTNHVSLNPSPNQSATNADVSMIEKSLLDGNHLEAINRACDGGLWSHALLLSFHSRDSELYKTVLQRFVSTSLLPGQPLRTLYSMFINEKSEFMFGQDGATVLAERWRENLLITVNNKAPNTSQVLSRIGDGLLKTFEHTNSFSHLYASHLSFLMADVVPSPEAVSGVLNSRKGSVVSVKNLNFDKLGLIGVPNDFVFCWSELIEGILLTDLFEYSKILGNSQYSLSSLLPFKAAMVSILADFGLDKGSIKWLTVVCNYSKQLNQANYESLKIPPNFKNYVDFLSRSVSNNAIESAQIFKNVFSFFKSKDKPKKESKQVESPSSETSKYSPQENTSDRQSHRKSASFLGRIKSLVVKEDEFTPMCLDSNQKMIYTEGVGWHRPGEDPKAKPSLPPPPKSAPSRLPHGQQPQVQQPRGQQPLVSNIPPPPTRMDPPPSTMAPPPTTIAPPPTAFGDLSASLGGMTLAPPPRRTTARSGREEGEENVC
ncbi:hypothetical protein GEMRC1_006260 [Eukaryota sp. GEM-RC1]